MAYWAMIGQMVGGMMSQGSQKEPWAEGRQNFERMNAQSQGMVNADLHQPQPQPAPAGMQAGSGGNKFDLGQFTQLIDMFKKKNPYDQSNWGHSYGGESTSNQGGGFWGGMFKGLGG